MPYLWSTIRVSSDHHGPNEVQFMLEWLNRAAAVRKTLFLGLVNRRRHGYRWGPLTLEPFHVISASYSFQKLLVSIDCYSFDIEDNEDIVLPNQLLEHLEELNLDETSVKLQHDAKLPHLQSLSITSYYGNFQHYSTAIPWSQIRHLTLSKSFTPAHLLFSILKQCPRLEYCKIEDPTDLHTPGPFQNITLPNFQSFELSDSETDIFGVECIQRLIIPYPAIVLMECGYISLFTVHKTVRWYALPTHLDT